MRLRSGLLVLRRLSLATSWAHLPGSDTFALFLTDRSADTGTDGVPDSNTDSIAHGDTNYSSICYA